MFLCRLTKILFDHSTSKVLNSTRYRSLNARFLLFLYVGMLVNGILFLHAHRLADGTIITHAHPYKPGRERPNPAK